MDDTVNHVTIIEHQLREVLAELASQKVVLADLQAKVNLIVSDKPTGVEAVFGVPTTRKGVSEMKCTLTKKTNGGKMAAKAVKGAAAPVGFTFQDNQDATFTVMGTDSAGASVDISAVATLTAASDNTAVLTVDSVVGMGSTIHGLTPGSANLTLVATWTDGSVGPFTITVPINVSGTAATGLTVTFGSPTVR
jgi:hypothetical protein